MPDPAALPDSVLDEYAAEVDWNLILNDPRSVKWGRRVVAQVLAAHQRRQEGAVGYVIGWRYRDTQGNPHREGWDGDWYATREEAEAVLAPSDEIEKAVFAVSAQPAAAGPVADDRGREESPRCIDCGCTHVHPGDEHVIENPGCILCRYCSGRGLNAAPAVQAPAQPEGEHRYLSTACVHERHRECRQVCKFCTARCVCSCHEGERAAAEPGPGQDEGEQVCNQEWIDIDGESHRCVKGRMHRDGHHQDQAGNRWEQRYHLITPAPGPAEAAPEPGDPKRVELDEDAIEVAQGWFRRNGYSWDDDDAVLYLSSYLAAQIVSHPVSGPADDPPAPDDEPHRCEYVDMAKSYAAQRDQARAEAATLTRERDQTRVQRDQALEEVDRLRALLDNAFVAYDQNRMPRWVDSARAALAGDGAE